MNGNIASFSVGKCKGWNKKKEAKADAEWKWHSWSSSSLWLFSRLKTSKQCDRNCVFDEMIAISHIRQKITKKKKKKVPKGLEKIVTRRLQKIKIHFPMNKDFVEEVWGRWGGEGGVSEWWKEGKSNIFDFFFFWFFSVWRYKMIFLHFFIFTRVVRLRLLRSRANFLSLWLFYTAILAILA